MADDPGGLVGYDIKTVSAASLPAGGGARLQPPPPHTHTMLLGHLPYPTPYDINMACANDDELVTHIHNNAQMVWCVSL